MYQWNEELGCLCDYMGLPISRSDAKEALKALREHLKKTPAQLAKLHNSVMQAQYPHMVDRVGEKMPGDMT